MSPRTPSFAAVIAVGLLAFFGSSVLACIVGTGTSDSCTEAALNACFPGGGSFDGTVSFNCGGAATITVTTTKIISADTSIDGGGVTTISGGNAMSVFSVNAGVTFTVQNLTISNGFTAGKGGGISNNGGTVTVTNSAFSANVAFDIANSTSNLGGAIYNGGTLTVANSTFSSNLAFNGGAIFGQATVTESTFSGNMVFNTTNAGGVGGAIDSGDTTLIVTNSTFSGNTNASGGGAIHSGIGMLAVTNCTFSQNVAGLAGGILKDGGTMTVTSSTFSGNVSSEGGAIFCGHTTLTVTDSSFSGNAAANQGVGGAISEFDTTLTVTNSTFSGNNAWAGGAIKSGMGMLRVTNCTFSGNSTFGAGGGGAIANGGSLTLTNSTFFGNSATNGEGAAINTGFGTVTVVNSTLANSTAGGNCSTSSEGMTGTITDGGHNIDDGTTCGFSTANGSLNNTDPKFDPAGLKYNGGPTGTIALEAGSPAINAGDETVCMAPPVNNLDQRGFVRPGHGAANCSIGAYEFNAGSPACVTPPAGLVSWWPGEGDAADIADGNNGTLQGFVGFVPGEVGQAFSFAGVDGGGVLVGNPVNLQLNSDFTIDAWIKRSRLDVAGSTNGAGFIVAYGDEGYGFGLEMGDELFLTKVGGDSEAADPSLRVVDTAFHHVAVTKSGSTVTFYLDGIPGVPIVYDSGFLFAKSLSLGARLDVSPPTAIPGTYTFAGLLDEIEIFNRALTAGEIGSIFSAGSAGKCKVAPDCGSEPVAATFASIDCRLVALLAQVTTAESDLGASGPKLVQNLSKAKDAEEAGASACAASDLRLARQRLKQAIRDMIEYAHHLQTLWARKKLPGALRTELLAAGNPIMDDAESLKRTVQCPADAPQ